jgi:hypothetical protein
VKRIQRVKLTCKLNQSKTMRTSTEHNFEELVGLFTLLEIKSFKIAGRCEKCEKSGIMLD